jgi:pimeloyl-ACP methyl ester carboxylesterase
MQSMRDLIKWSTRIALGLVGVTALVIASGYGWERWSETRDASEFPPPGRMFDVGDGKRHIFCDGQGAPTVVLVSGGGVPSILLRPLQDQVMRFTRVCAYDRAGLGWSEPATRALNIADQAAELRRLLVGVGEPGPYVMVGHSMGGLIVRRFAADAPSEVSGMVLVDAAEEGVVFQSQFLATVPAGVAAYRRLESLARLGVARAVVAADPAQARLPAALNAGERRTAIALMVRPSFFRGAAEEAAGAYARTPLAMQKPGGFGRLDSIPLIVIRHGRPFTGAQAPMEVGWTQSQARLAALSSDSVTVVAPGAGHLISETAPGVTASALADVVGAIREHRTLSQAGRARPSQDPRHRPGMRPSSS